MAPLLEEISIKSNDEHYWNPFRVLSTWLWLKELKHIYHDIPGDASYTRFVEDVRHLIGIIRRMPNPVLESLHVRNRYPDGDDSEEELHLKLWRGLLEAAFEKGSRKLVVQEPESLYAYPFQNRARLWPHPRREIGFIDNDEADDDEYLGLVKRLFRRILPSRQTTMSEETELSVDTLTSPSSASPCGATLRDIDLQSKSFFQRPFLPFTIGNFQHHSETISSLTIHETYFPIARKVWRKLLQSISLPVLSFLELQNTHNLSLKDFADFLSRHLWITELNVYGNWLDSQILLDSGTEQSPMLHEPSLKNLTKVRARPHLLAWIFSCPSAITNLRFVHLLGRSTNPNEDFWFSDLKQALDTIHSSPTPSSSSSSSSDAPFAELIASGIELEINFNFDNKHTANHMMDQVQFFRSSDQRQRPWPEIIKLVLVNIRYPAESPYFNGALPEWVWVFPSLEELELEWDVAPCWGFVNPKFERKMELISRALASRCPKVKVLSG